MSKNEYISNIGSDQIVNRKFDDSQDADRVFIVNSEFNIDSNKIAHAVKEGLSNLTIGHSESNNVPKIQTIEKNVFIPQLEIKIIEVPVIVKEIQIKEIEKQIYIPQIEYREVEKPIIVEKIEYREINTNNVPNWIKYALFGQMALIMLSFLMRR